MFEELMKNNNNFSLVVTAAVTSSMKMTCSILLVHYFLSLLYFVPRVDKCPNFVVLPE